MSIVDRAEVGVGPEDVLTPRFWLGSAINGRGQFLSVDGAPIATTGVTFLWRSPSGTQIELAGIWDAAAQLWRCPYQPDQQGTWAVRLRSAEPQRMTDWQAFAVVAPDAVPPPAAALWLLQDGRAVAATNGGLLTGVRIGELPPATELTGGLLPMVRPGLGDAHLTVEQLRGDARDQAAQQTALLEGRVVTLEGDAQSLDARLAALEYVAPVVSALSVSPAVAEVGATVTSVVLTVTRNRMDLPVTITGDAAGTIPAGQSSATLTGSWTADATWTATVTDPAPPPGLPTSGSRSVALPFRLRRYWGVSDSATPDDAAIRAMASEFATPSSGRRTATLSPAGQYVVYAQPADWPIAASVGFGSLTTNAFTDTVRNFTNASGATESYRVRVLSYPLSVTEEFTF